MFKPDGSLYYHHGETSDSVLSVDLSQPSGFLSGFVDPSLTPGLPGPVPFQPKPPTLQNPGPLDVYVVFLKTDPDFVFSLKYIDQGQVIADFDIHMTIADWTFQGADGSPLAEVAPTWKRALLAGAQAVQDAGGGSSSSTDQTQPSTADPEGHYFRSQITGLDLTPDVSINVTGYGVTDSYIDDLVAQPGGFRSAHLAALLSSQDILYADLDGPATADERARIKQDLALNVIQAPQGQAELKTKFDVQRRTISTPGVFVVELQDGDGVYRLGDHIRGTIVAGQVTPYVYAWADNELIHFDTEVTRVDFDFIADRPGYITISGGVLNTHLGLLPGQATGVPLRLGKTLIHVLDVGEAWSPWQQHAWDALRPAGQGVPGDGISRNRTITKLYADLFDVDKNAPQNRFEWAGMAAFASKGVGDGLAKAVSMMMFKDDAAGIGGPDLARLYHGLSDGNLAIYMDMYPQMLAYKDKGLGEINDMLVRGEIKDDQQKGWVLIDDGIKKGDIKEIWDGNYLFADVEQRVTLQKVLDKDLDLWQRATNSLVATWAGPIRAPFPGYDGTFQDFRKTDPDVADDASFADADARMIWFKKKVYPSWQTWRLTNATIDLKKLLNGDYKK